MYNGNACSLPQPITGFRSKYKQSEGTPVKKDSWSDFVDKTSTIISIHNDPSINNKPLPSPHHNSPGKKRSKKKNSPSSPSSSKTSPLPPFSVYLSNRNGQYKKHINGLYTRLSDEEVANSYVLIGKNKYTFSMVYRRQGGSDKSSEDLRNSSHLQTHFGYDPKDAVWLLFWFFRNKTDVFVVGKLSNGLFTIRNEEGQFKPDTHIVLDEGSYLEPPPSQNLAISPISTPSQPTFIEEEFGTGTPQLIIPKKSTFAEQWKPPNGESVPTSIYERVDTLNEPHVILNQPQPLPGYQAPFMYDLTNTPPYEYYPSTPPFNHPIYHTSHPMMTTPVNGYSTPPLTNGYTTTPPLINGYTTTPPLMNPPVTNGHSITDINYQVSPSYSTPISKINGLCRSNLFRFYYLTSNGYEDVLKYTPILTLFVVPGDVSSVRRKLSIPTPTRNVGGQKFTVGIDIENEETLSCKFILNLYGIVNGGPVGLVGSSENKVLSNGKAFDMCLKMENEVEMLTSLELIVLEWY